MAAIRVKPTGCAAIRCICARTAVTSCWPIAAHVAPAPDEARELVAALNTPFAQDGLVFRAPRPARWYLGLDRVPALVTRALPDVAGKDIDRYLPTGDDRLRWHHVLNEIQMLLHAHPVNQAREALNQPAINSVRPLMGPES